MRELTAGARKENCFCRESRSPPRYSQEVDSYVCPLSSTADLKSLAELSQKFLEIYARYDERSLWCPQIFSLFCKELCPLKDNSLKL